MNTFRQRIYRVRRWVGADDSFLKWLVYTVASTIIWVHICLLGTVVALMVVSGFTPNTIVSGSMEPALSPGDIVLSDDDGMPESGSIIVFDDGDRQVTHRVVEKVVDGYRTKGDANLNADSDIVPFSAVEGTTRVVVPYAGMIRYWLSEKQYLVLVLWGVTVVGSGWVAARWRMVN